MMMDISAIFRKFQNESASKNLKCFTTRVIVIKEVIPLKLLFTYTFYAKDPYWFDLEKLGNILPASPFKTIIEWVCCYL